MNGRGIKEGDRVSIRLLAITQAPDDPATRYRLGQYASLLAERGVEITPIEWPREESERRTLIGRAREFDSVVVFRRLLRQAHVRALRQATPHLVYDFDDTVTRRDSSLGVAWPLLDKVLQFRTMVGCADAVAAGNNYLADLARRSGARGEVVVIPTTIDLARYPKVSARRKDGSNVIGWIGQASTLFYLERLAPALRQLQARFPSLVLRCIGAPPTRLKKLNVEFRAWSKDREVADLNSFDVGLAPLIDDAWTRGKCGLRLLQYLAAGVPAVASPVGVQGEIARQGAACAARTNEEWVTHVSELLRNNDRRNNLREAGRSLVENHFTPSRWIDVIERLWCGRGTVGLARDSA